MFEWFWLAYLNYGYWHNVTVMHLSARARGQARTLPDLQSWTSQIFIVVHACAVAPLFFLRNFYQTRISISQCQSDGRLLHLRGSESRKISVVTGLSSLVTLRVCAFLHRTNLTFFFFFFTFQHYQHYAFCLYCHHFNAVTQRGFVFIILTGISSDVTWN